MDCKLWEVGGRGVMQGQIIRYRMMFMTNQFGDSESDVSALKLSGVVWLHTNKSGGFQSITMHMEVIVNTMLKEICWK